MDHGIGAKRLGRAAGAGTGLLVACLVGAVACGDQVGPGDRVTAVSIPGLMVSQPVHPQAAMGLAGSASSPGGGVVYVSLAPGSVSGGVTATIRAPLDSQAVTVAVVDGGFDPVGLTASV